MTFLATIGKQLGGRFALIEILRVRGSTKERTKRAEHQQGAPQPWP
jgi:hypothetical protein